MLQRTSQRTKLTPKVREGAVLAPGRNGLGRARAAFQLAKDASAGGESVNAASAISPLLGMPGLSWSCGNFTWARGGLSRAGVPCSRPELQRFFGQTPLAALADEIEHGPLRTLILVGAAAITCVPEPHRMTKALKSLDALGVVDVMPSETTDLATHIMPATGTLERTDLNGLLVTPFTPTLSQPVVKPVAERMHCWQMVAQLAKRLGVLDKLLGDVDLDTYTEEDLVRHLTAHARHSFEELQAAGPYGVSYDTRRRWALETAVPEGKWRVAPAALVERLPSLLAGKTDERFPLRLISGRSERRHNRFDNADKPKNSESPLLRMSVEDAGRLGIIEGSHVRIRSAHGEIKTRATILETMRAGVVQLPHGWPDVNVNQLTTNMGIDTLTTQPQMSAFAVSVELLEPAMQ